MSKLHSDHLLIDLDRTYSSITVLSSLSIVNQINNAFVIKDFSMNHSNVSKKFLTTDLLVTNTATSPHSSNNNNNNKQRNNSNSLSEPINHNSTLFNLSTSIIESCGGYYGLFSQTEQLTWPILLTYIIEKLGFKLLTQCRSESTISYTFQRDTLRIEGKD